MRNHRLDPDVHPPLPGCERFTQRGRAGGVDDVDVRAEQLGERAEMVYTVRLDNGWARASVPLGAGLAGREQRLLERVDGVSVLAMRRHDDAELLGELHGRKQVLVGEVQGTLVREE